MVYIGPIENKGKEEEALIDLFVRCEWQKSWIRQVTDVTYRSSLLLPLKLGTGRTSSSLLDHPCNAMLRLEWIEVGEKPRTE